MATTVDLTSNFSGTWSGDYFLESVIESNTVQAISVKDGIKYKDNLPNLDTTGDWTAASCNFTPTGTVDTEDRELVLVGLDWEREICLKDALRLWDSETMGKEYPGANLPTIFQSFLLADQVAKAAAAIENMIWQGPGTSGTFLGFIPRFLLDSGVPKVTSPVAITSSNVIDKFRATLAIVPRAILDAATPPKMFIPPSVLEAFIDSQQDLGYLDKYNADNPIPYQFRGRYELVVCNGMPDNTIVVARPENLWFGCGDLGDTNTIEMVDFRKTTMDKKIGFQMTAGMNVQYRRGSEIGLYHYDPS